MSQPLFVSTRKGLFRLERGSAGWDVAQSAFIGDNVTLCLPDPRDGSVLAALDHGHFGPKVHRSADGGDTWEEWGCPSWPERGEGDPPALDGSGRELPATVELIWELQAGLADQPGLLWCGTIPGGLFKSEDGGQTWAFVDSLWNEPGREKWFGGGADWPGLHSICIDPRDGEHVTLGVSCGGVWDSTDGGGTWRVAAEGMWANYMPPDRKLDPFIQDPHRLAQCAADPDTIWSQHHNGVFVTRDGAKSWREVPNVPPSTFGFAVAVHPTDGDTAWLVPALSDEHRVPVDGRVVVTRTRDGGESFEVLTRGLPQRHAYDLVFRHALDVDDRGEILAFGSTTGAVFVSEDQGDSWTRVSAHLPPVYAVRFG